MSGPRPTHLIVVCCHGIWKGGPTSGNHESEWLIADFQAGETPTFAGHARVGVELARTSKEDNALAFSGGPTRRETRLSEGQSYANLAEANQYWGLGTPARILVEDRALDSYHNILFSLTLFRTTYGAWPLHLTIVSHAFKKVRAVNGHCAAIGFPLDRVSFIGIDPPGVDAAHTGIGTAQDGWSKDIHGKGPSLAGKRRRRNPWAVWQGVFQQGAVVQELEIVGSGEEETIVDNAVRPWM